MASGIGFNDTVRALGEIQKTNTWKLQVLLNPECGITLDSSTLLLVQGFEYPVEESTHIEETLNNYKISQPGNVSRAGETTLEAVENTDGVWRDFLDKITNIKWSNTSNDSKGLSLGWKKIKGEAVITLLDSTGKKTTAYKLMDCEFVADPLGGASAESGDGAALKAKLKIKYNWWLKV